MCFTTKTRNVEKQNSRNVSSTLMELNENEKNNVVKKNNIDNNNRKDNVASSMFFQTKYLSPETKGSIHFNKSKLGRTHFLTSNNNNNDNSYIKRYKLKVNLPPISSGQYHSIKSHPKVNLITYQTKSNYFNTDSQESINNTNPNTNNNNNNKINKNNFPISLKLPYNNNNTSKINNQPSRNNLSLSETKINPQQKHKNKLLPPFHHHPKPPKPSMPSYSSQNLIIPVYSNTNINNSNKPQQHQIPSFIFKAPKIKTNHNISTNPKEQSSSTTSLPLSKQRALFTFPSKSKIKTITKFPFSLIRHSELSQNGKNDFGKVKTNQDSYIMIDSLFDLGDVLIYGVMDGHGQNGHLASKYVKDAIKDYFSTRETYITNKKAKFLINSNIIYNKITKNDYSFLCSFVHNLHEDLTNKAKFDIHFSGTTLNLIFQLGGKLINCNVGDSRSIIITQHKNENKQNKVEAFSTDHKPDIWSEYERIVAQGGEVAPCPNETLKNGIKRIWVKNEKYPGIAISRTIGDLVAHSVGVIETPEFNERDIIEDNICAVVCASDGIWEFLENEDVKNIVMKHYHKGDTKSAVNEIVKEASMKWREEGVVMDDITCIVVFYDLDSLRR